MTVVECAAAVGKTYLGSFLAAVVTLGGRWPEKPSQRQPVGNVLYFCRERNMQDCLTSRLYAQNADTMRVMFKNENATRQASAPAPQTTAEVTPDAAPEPAGEKFSKSEFLAENGGKQPVSVEPSDPRAGNKSAPYRQPAPAAKTQNDPRTLNAQKTFQSPVTLASESRPPMTPIDNGRRSLENVKSWEIRRGNA